MDNGVFGIEKNLNGSTDPQVSLEILQQVLNYLTNLTDYSKIDQLLASIFPVEDGILTFLVTNAAKKEQEKSKLVALQIIQWFISNNVIENSVWPLCQRIHKVLDILWRNQRETSKVQVAALDSIILLFKNFENNVTVASFELATLYRDVLTASEKSTYTPTVRGKMFHCLGLIASFGSTSFLENEGKYFQLLRHYVAIISSQVESNYSHMESAILLGCIRGFEKFLFAFQNKISQDRPEIKTFYDKLEKIVDPNCSITNDDESVKVKRREFQRAGLDFVASHGAYFFQSFFEHCDWWFENLLKWAKSTNAEDSKSGMKAVMKFMETISSLSEDQTQNVANQQKMQKFIQFFTEAFTKILDNKDCHRSELTVAVKGSGLLAKVCGDPSIVEQLFNRIVKQIDAIIIELNMPVVDKYSGSHSMIPTYLEAVGNMLLAMTVSDEESRQSFQNRLVTVENLSILLITVYPDLGERRKPYAPKCFSTVVEGLYGRHYKYCESFLERIVHEGLTHIISSPTQSEADILIEAFNQQNASRKLNEDGKTKSVYSRLGIKIVKFYTSFWTGLIEGSQYADGIAKDKLIYNTVIEWVLKTIGKLDLSLEFLDDEKDSEETANIADPAYNTKANVVKDFQLFINTVDFLCVFVKNVTPQLFEDWIESFVEKTLQYLKDHALVSGFYHILDLVFEMTRKLNYFESPERGDILKRCCHFLESTSNKIQEIRDELLLAILDVWLSAPDQMVLKSYSSLGETLQCVFRTGRNCLPLAFRGIQAIERWFQIQDFPEDEMERLMNKLFPSLKLYFTTKEDEPEARIHSVSKAKGRLQERRMKALSSEFKEMTLRKLQFEILRLLGSYGHLINVDADVEDDGYCSFKHKGFTTESRFLQYAVPFQDLKPDFYFDDFLPPLLETCHTAGDRQLRSTACEVFHAVVLYFIGHCSNHGKLPPFDLSRRIFQSIIQLGCDSDSVIRQLFNTLTLQTIRWYSAPNQREFGKILLRCIIDGLVQSEDPPRRDFSTTCLQEYFRFCLKQSGHDLQYGNHVIRDLIALSQHAASQYRQGSVLGFNSIYRELREHRNFPNQYCFQFVHSYIINLSLSNNLDEHSMLIRTTKQALLHLERIITIKKEQFNIKLSGREVPSDFKGPTLNNLVDWLLRKSAESGFHCRRECFRLIVTLAPCIKGIGSLENYLNQFDSKELLELAEKNFLETEPNQQRNFEDFVHSLDITSDFYSFVKRAGYPVKVLIKRQDSIYVTELVKFLNKFESEMKNYDTDTSNIYMMALSMFCSIGFLDNILSIDTEARIIALSALVSAKGNEKNPMDLRQVVDTWKKLWQSCGTADVQLELDAKLCEIFDLDISEGLSANRVVWLKSVAQHGFLLEMWKPEKISTILRTIWKFIDDKLFESCRTGFEEKSISNQMKNLVEALFSLGLELGTDGNLIADKLFDPTIVEQQQRVNGRILKTTKGEIFQKFFISYVPQCPKMLDFTTLKETVSMEKLGQLVQKLLVEVKNKKHLRKEYGTIVVEKTIQIWRYLALNCSGFVVSGLISGLASLNMSLCRNSEELSEWWCGPNMMNDVNTSLKEKSEFIHFLGLFGLSKKKNIVTKVMSTVHELLERSLNSSLNWRDEENYLLKIFHVILTVFDKIPRNREILNIVILFTARVADMSSDSCNSCSLMVKKKLEHVVMKFEANMEAQLDIARRIYSLIVTEQPQFRTTMSSTKYCLLPVVTSLNELAAKDFYKKIIVDLMAMAKSTPVSILEWNLKITGLNLLEALVLLKSQQLFFTSPELNNCYVEDPKTQPKKLSLDIVKICTVMTSPNGNEEMRRLILSCNQAAYNVLTAALVKMVGKPETVNKIAVMMTSTTGQWANIIDCEPKFKFPIVFEQVLKDDQGSDWSDSSVENSSDDALNLTKAAIELNSRAGRKNALVSSSLAIDATNYDFTAAVTVNDSKYYQKIFGNASAATTSSKSQLNNGGGTSDWNHFNQHDCMQSFSQCLRYLAKTQVEGSNRSDAPAWIKSVKDYLTRSSVHCNIKLFFVGTILNCKDIFKPYTTELMEPIINMIHLKCFGEDFNYFVKDVIVMLLEWHEPDISSDLVKKLLNFIVPNIHNDRKDVYYQNLQIFEAVVKHWVTSQRNEIPFQTISEKMKEPKPRLGLDLCKQVLRAGQLPCKNEITSFQDLFKSVGKCFSNTSKPIYSLAGDVIGLLFSKLQHMDSVHLEDAVNLERQLLDKERKNRPPVFLIILKGIQKNYPTFALHYKSAIFELLKTNQKTEALNLLPGILKSELDEGEDRMVSPEMPEHFFSDLEGRGLFRTACKNDEEAEAGLELLGQVVHYLKDESKLLRIVNWVEKAEHSPDVKLQVCYAETISKIFFNFGGRRGKNHALSTKAMKLFVKHLKDDKDELKEVTNDFWESNLKSCKNSQSLVLELMEILADDQYSIPICVNLIMKRCSLSPDYIKDIFKPLSETCGFYKYDLNTSWRQRYSSYQPLYAESLSSSQNFSQLPSVLQSAVMSQRQANGKTNLLKATLQNIQFSLTAAAKQKDSIGMSMDQSIPSSFNPDAFFGDLGQLNLDNSESTVSSQDESSNVLAHLRKRFYERPTQFYAHRQVEKQEAVVESEVEDMRKKKSGINLVRSYRIGELPDVVIKHADFLSTISSLIKMDEELGRKFLVHLFTNMVKEIRTRDSDMGSKFCKSAATYFNSILQKYESSISPHFAAAIIEIAAVNNLFIEPKNAQSALISIKPELITETSRNFHLQRLAILQLERLLEEDSISETSEVKRARIPGMEGKEADILLRIAELYKDLEDFDAVRNVFSMAGKASVESAEKYNEGSTALLLENDGQFPEALEIYSTLCNLENENPENKNERRAQFWDASVYKCLRQISRWDTMFERTEHYQMMEGINPDNLLTNLSYMENILPNQVMSGVQILVRDQSPEDDEPEIIGRVRNFVDETKSKEEIWEHFVEEYSTDLAVLSAVFRHEYGHTELLLDKSYSKLLETFQQFDKFSSPQKKEQLLKLQRSSVLQDYLHCYKTSTILGTTPDDIEDSCFKLISKWKHCGKSRTSSLINLDTIVAQKDHVLTTLGQIVDNDDLAMLDSKDHIIREFQSINYNQHLWLVELSILNGNERISEMTMHKAKSIGDELDEVNVVTLQRLYCQHLMAFSNVDKWEHSWSKAWKALRTLVSPDQMSLWEIKSDLLRSLLSKLTYGSLANENRVRKAFGIDAGEDLLKYTVDEATTLAQTVISTEMSSSVSRTRLHMRLYNLLNTIKSKCETSIPEQENRSLQKYLLISLLRSMEHGDSEALHLFPSIFSILTQFPDLVTTFQDLVKNVPSWMFLPWLDQIVANWKSTENFQSVMNPIIDRLLTDYPQAFQLEYTDLLKRKRLSNVSIEYTEALKAVVMPSIFFKSYTDAWESAANPLKPEKLAGVFEEFKQKLVEVRDNIEFFGDMHTSYAEKLLPQIESYEKLLQERSSHVNPPDEEMDDYSSSQSTIDDYSVGKSLLDGLKNFQEANKKLEDKRQNNNLALESLSPWLANFRSFSFQDFLEVPGLYCKFEKPNVEYHPKIVSFQPTVMLMHSITRPIRITMRCDNGKEVNFLVKKGDDLKQDKRIQQCFHMTNEIFHGDTRCRERNMRILTYSVIPITNDFGMIRWIDKTMPLKKLIIRSPELDRASQGCIGSFENYMAMYSSARYPNSKSKYKYHIHAEVVSRAEAERHFDVYKSKLPQGLMRKSVMEGSSSLEEYFVIREKMIRSYATLCFVHWILGIGDRHLDNCLISYDTGEFLGIDFGRSFGVTIFHHPIPELVPFRLTPQIQDFLSPYGCNGVFKEIMIYAKRSMKKSAESMASVIDVFIKDPLVDWLKRRIHSENDASTGSIAVDKDNWDAIKIVNMKLMGRNPIRIIAEDLSMMSKKEVEPVYTNILMDGKEDVFSNVNMTDEEYVDALISVATDKNILVRLYSGWCSWI